MAHSRNYLTFKPFRELYSRDKLDSYLSRALNVPLEMSDQKKFRLSAIDNSKYVLTLDFAIKMLNIHERAKCGIPVIIEGETGVGKTALIEMLSKLWTFSRSKNWSLFIDRFLDFIRKKLDGNLKPVLIVWYLMSTNTQNYLDNKSCEM